MDAPLVAVTGFGPFEDVGTNPSGELARGLAARPPAGVRVVSCVLPVSFVRSPAELARFLAELGEPPALLLSLGVHRDPGFRLERRARAVLDTPDRPDVDGVSAAGAPASGGPDRTTDLDVDALCRALHARGAGDAFVSDEAGGYVCERTYHAALGHAVPALFLHTPKEEFAPLERQLEVCTWVIEWALG